MHLLVENRLSEFHSECELLSNAEKEVNYVKFPILLEQEIMEGAYSKVLALSSKQPSHFYAHFMEQLIETVRSDISDCAEKSYEKLAMTEAQKMFMIENKNDFLAFIESKRDNGWVVEGNNIVFKVGKKSQIEIPSLKLIAQTLEYAQEMERIV